MSLFDKIRLSIAKRKYSDIVQLHQQLDYLNVPHDLLQAFDGFQVLVLMAYGDINSPTFQLHTNSVIQHQFSYGLEAYGFGNREVAGYLTVEKAAEMIQDYVWDGENAGVRNVTAGRDEGA